MDFAALPPEINSSRMYTGPGSGPMLATAAAWQGLAAVLDHAAVTYAAAIAGLAIDSWTGPTAAVMTASATHCVDWLRTAAIQAEGSAIQAQDAAAAFETAFAMTVPPPLIAANRAELLTLAATNFLGQNSPAIEANQAEYAEMWAQDAAAMYSYARTSEIAAALTPFTPPSSATDPAGLAAQSAAVAAATDASIAGDAQAAIAGLMTQYLSTVQSLGTEVSAAADVLPDDVIKFPTLIGDLEVTAMYMMSTATAGLSLNLVNTVKQRNFPNSAGPWGHGVSDVDSSHGDTSGVLVSTLRGTAVSDVGHAASIGSLTVPHSWTAAAPEIKLAVESLPSSGLQAAPLQMDGAPAGLLSGMALASLAGRNFVGTAAARNPAAENKDNESRRKPAVVVIRQQTHPR